MTYKKHRRLFLETLERRIVLTGQIPSVTIDGLVSWYRAEDGVASDTAGANEGTLKDGATTEPGLVGDAFRINYSPRRVEIDDHPSLRLQTFTIDAWVFAYSGGQIANALGGEIIAKDVGDGSQGVSLAIFGPGSGGRFTFAATKSGGSTESFQSVPVTQGLWHHVAMTTVVTPLGTFIRGYVNGALQSGQIPVTAPISYDTEAPIAPWTIGGHAGLVSSEFAGHFYDGLIDEVGIYQRGLSQPELQAIVARGSNGRYAIDSGQLFTLPGAFADVDSSSWTGNVNYGDGSGVQALALNADHTFSLAHVYSSVGQYTITASITDDTSNTTPHSLVVNVTPPPPNTAPVANNDGWSVNEDETLIVPASGVLANDVDAEGNPMTAVLVAGPSHGNLTLNTNGSFNYTPAANYNGPDSYTYKANDGTADSNVAIVSITVIPVNDAPMAVNDAYSTAEDTMLTVATPGILANDTDVEGNTLTSILVTGPSHGTLTQNADGSFTYTPDPNYNGSDSYTYKANDGAADSNVATVNISVTSVNDVPVAFNDSYTTAEDTMLTVAAPGVLANDTDVDGDTLTSILVTDPSHGTLTLNADGSFAYTPDANYNGPDSYTYKANDGTADSNVATVSITVSAVNHLPTVSTLGLNLTSINEGDSVLLSGTVSDVDAADSHTVTINWGDGSALQVAPVTGPTHAFSVTHLYVDDNPTSTPSDDYQIRVTATDNHGGVSPPAAATLTVYNVAPVANPIGGPASGVPGMALSFTGSFTDVGTADTQAFAWQALDSSGVVIATGSGPGFTFVPSTSDSYTVQLSVTDDDGGTGTATTAVDVVVVQMLDDPDRPAMTMLEVGGTNGNDTFTLTPTATAGEYRLDLNGLNLGAFSPTGSVQIFGNGGVDTIVLNGNSSSNAFEIHADRLVLNALPFFDHAIATRTINALGSGDTITVYGGSATIDGGAASDTLVATGVISHDWQITAQNTGNLDGLVYFSSVELLVGGAGADTFHLADNARITGSVNGGGGSDLLIAPDSANTWTIGSANGGTVKNTDFSGIETLRGGSAGDTFRIIPGAAFAGTLDGSAGTDTLDYSAFTTPVAVNLALVTPSATGVGGVSGFEDIEGGSGSDFLVGNAADNVITGRNGDDIILGWSGNDSLSGDAGLDLIVGGLGMDLVHGNQMDDILVGGSLLYANDNNSTINWAALNAIMAEWRRELAYSLRIEHLSVNSSGGLNNGYMLSGTTVLDDGDVDTLYGDGGQDWFLAGMNDVVKSNKGEVTG